MASTDINRRLETGFSLDQTEINHGGPVAGNTRDVTTQSPNLELRHPRCACNIKVQCKEVKTQVDRNNVVN